ncbi:MAG: ATP-binding cassette domain-containing protein [Clostridiales bacterium]|nr:ATP-binding cassette domain-containing protein [Clostridiales bacterium]
MDDTPIIQLRGLNKTFGTGEKQVVALDQIDLDIYAGEIFGVIGLSGAGKSTLVRCMNLLERPTAGEVILDGKNLMQMSNTELRMARRSIGMIFQGFNLLMQRTALDNICFPLELMGVQKKKARVRAMELLETVGLGDRAKAYPAQLSGGQKQRVAIARALATKPKVLLCDEATSALDPTTTLAILELLKQLNSDLGVTVVVITHEMKVIEQICGRVAILAHSNIVELGAVEDIFRHPKSEAAHKLIFPGGFLESDTGCAGKCLRLIFDGNVRRPVVSEMVLMCGAPVNISYADTKTIDGQEYGHMLIQLPSEETMARKMLGFLDSAGVTYVEEEAKEA